MSRRISTLIILMLVAFVIHPMAQAHVQHQESWPITVTPLAEILGDAASEKGLKTAVISHDGSRIAWYEIIDRDIHICLHLLGNMQSDCHFHESRVHPGSLSWSADDHYLAFGNDFIITFQEPDIWVFDTLSGGLTDLTDDGIDANLLAPSTAAKPQMDMLPVWNPAVSRQLYFFRTNLVTREQYSLSLCSLDVTTGETTVIYEFGAQFPLFSVYDFSEQHALDGRAVVSPDGTKLAFIVFGTPPEDPRSGVWLLDLAGETPPKQVFAFEFAGSGLPAWNAEARWGLSGIGWLAGGEQLVVYAESTASQTADTSGDNVGSNVFFVDVQTEEIASLADFTNVASTSDYLSPDETGYALSSFAPLSPALLGSTLIARTYQFAAPDTQDEMKQFLRIFSSLPDSDVSEVVYAFDDPSFVAMPVSVSNDGKAIMGGYLIELANIMP